MLEVKTGWFVNLGTVFGGKDIHGVFVDEKEAKLYRDLIKENHAHVVELDYVEHKGKFCLLEPIDHDIYINEENKIIERIF